MQQSIYLSNDRERIFTLYSSNLAAEFAHIMPNSYDGPLPAIPARLASARDFPPQKPLLLEEEEFGRAHCSDPRGIYHKTIDLCSPGTDSFAKYAGHCTRLTTELPLDIVCSSAIPDLSRIVLRRTQDKWLIWLTL